MIATKPLNDAGGRAVLSLPDAEVFGMAQAGAAEMLRLVRASKSSHLDKF